ncbi:hypothetical protein [Metallosphaera hakonensis]|uniref:hypothetical protein n=1 Tax=Metallosphaera hakonensis TaxID=79601 RepID=UPI0020930F07|nr:hypothetical protein [Metallosphaera hakonensis]
MKFRSIYVKAIIGLMLLSSFFGMTSLGFGIYSPQFHFIMYAKPLEEPLAPGMTDVPINFTLINANGFTLTNVNITGFSVYPFQLINYYNNTQNISILQWSPGQAISVIYYYNIENTASQGVYNISVKVSGPIGLYGHFHKTLNSSVAILATLEPQCRQYGVLPHLLNLWHLGTTTFQ